MFDKKFLDRKSNLIYNKYSFSKDDIRPFEYDDKVFKEDVPNYSFLECGGSRIVYRKGNYVVKFAMNGHSEKNNGVEQIKNEVSLWNNANCNQKDNLSKIIDYSKDYKWIINPYYNNIFKHRSDSKYDENMIKDKLKKRGIRFEDGVIGNIAVVDGNFIIIDYGYRASLL